MNKAIDLDKDVNNEPTVAFVHLSAAGGETVSLIWADDRNLQSYLKEASITVASGQTVTVNGRRADDMKTPLEPDSIVVVAGKVVNG